MLIAALLLGLLLAGLVVSGSGWSNVLSTRRNELVFTGRNRAYGAYVLRREQHRTMLIATASATVLLSGMLTAPRLFMGDPLVGDPVPRSSEGTIVEILPPDLPPAPPTPPRPSPPSRPSSSGEVIVVDSTRTVVDTASTPPSPPTPPGPPGPPNPPGPVGPVTLLVDTAPHKSWETTTPEYPGGMDALYEDLRKLIKYPQIDIDSGREGKVYLNFVVTEDGMITQVQVARGVSRTIDAEATRAVRQLKKRWKPGKYEGQDTRVWFSLPISFKLKDQ